MSYTKKLQEIINKTKFTNVEIAKKCSELGVTVDRTYINKLYNGKTNPPKEEISKAIAKVCNANENELIFEGYLDRAPKEMIDVLQHIKKITNILFRNYLNKDLNKNTKGKAKDLSTFLVNSLAFTETDAINITKNISYAQNNARTNLLNLLGRYINDDSMSPIIPQNAQVTFITKKEYSNGDIIAFINKNDKEANEYIRYFFIEKDNVFLIPANQKFEKLTCKINEIEILGAVSSIIINL